ncbi:hypothetical protein VE03_05903 [Pseudogymnoascus sp. 23342-1-I1]|nr:hypothetical protein VE03_05903 [Pseudogymnoascus sp. 23342-1-I1]
MRSSLFFLVAGAIGFACASPQVDDVTDCKDGAGLVSCLQPLVDKSSDSSCTSSVSCACDLLKSEIDCYKSYCPEATIPAEATDTYNTQCANVKGAAGMLSVPGAGVIAGVVGVMAML